MGRRVTDLAELQESYTEEAAGSWGVTCLGNLILDVDNLGALRVMLIYLKERAAENPLHFSRSHKFSIHNFDAPDDTKIFDASTDTVEAIMAGLSEWSGDSASATGCGRAGTPGVPEREAYARHRASMAASTEMSSVLPESAARGGEAVVGVEPSSADRHPAVPMSAAAASAPLAAGEEKEEADRMYAGSGAAGVGTAEDTGPLSVEATRALQTYFSGGGFTANQARLRNFFSSFISRYCHTPEAFIALWNTIKVTRTTISPSDPRLPPALLTVMRETVSVGFATSLGRARDLSATDSWALTRQFSEECDTSLYGFLGACVQYITDRTRLADEWSAAPEISADFNTMLDRLWSEPPADLRLLARAHPLPPALASAMASAGDADPIPLYVFSPDAISSAYALARYCRAKTPLELKPFMSDKRGILDDLTALKRDYPKAFDEIMAEANKDGENPLLTLFQHAPGILYGVRPVGIANAELLEFQRLIAPPEPAVALPFADLALEDPERHRAVPTSGGLSING